MTDESYRVGDEIDAVCEQYRQGTITREWAEIKINNIYPPQPGEQLKKFQDKLQKWKPLTMGPKPYALIPDWARKQLEEIDNAKAGKVAMKDEAVVPWQMNQSSGGGDEREEQSPEEEELEEAEDETGEEDEDE